MAICQQFLSLAGDKYTDNAAFLYKVKCEYKSVSVTFLCSDTVRHYASSFISKLDKQCPADMLQ